MENKVICGCFNVTVDDVKKHIENGVSTFKEIQELTKMGTECPPCAETSEKAFKELLANK